jgi:hypothetical protein
MPGYRRVCQCVCQCIGIPERTGRALVTLSPWLPQHLTLAGVGREQAERSSGNAAKPVYPGAFPELRRQGSLLPADKKTKGLQRSIGSFSCVVSGQRV